MNSYDCVWAVQQDAFSSLLDELRHLELELGHLPQKWNVHMDKLELPPSDYLAVSCNILLVGFLALYSRFLVVMINICLDVKNFPCCWIVRY